MKAKLMNAYVWLVLTSMAFFTPAAFFMSVVTAIEIVQRHKQMAQLATLVERSEAVAEATQ